MRKVISFAVAALASLALIGKTSAQSLECDIACAVELYNAAGDMRLETVIANCGANEFSEDGFRITRIGQPTGCSCSAKVFCGYDQNGNYRTVDLPSGSDVDLPSAYNSAIIECR